MPRRCSRRRPDTRGGRNPASRKGNQTLDVQRAKVRIRFRKAGDVRFLGHHDLMRTFERMLRRAELPFRSSEGFHPKPKMAFASALGLGIVAWEEVVEVELQRPLPAPEVQERLAAQAPAGLEILSVRQIDPHRKAQVVAASYRLALGPDAPHDLAQRVQELLRQEECWLEPGGPKGHPTLTAEEGALGGVVEVHGSAMDRRVFGARRRVNLRAFVKHLAVEPEALTMELIVTPQGTVRPEAVLQVLRLSQVLARGAILERTRVTLQDETEPAIAGSMESS
jgi:radical SAM-linked protein